MSEHRPALGTTHLNGHPIRTARIEETDYVAVQDFCVYLQGLVGKIVELTTRQQDQMAAMSTTLDIVCDVIGEQHPTLKSALLQASQRRSRLV